MLIIERKRAILKDPKSENSKPLCSENEQGIIIGENTRIFVIGFNGHHVRLGISAPSSMRILREEVYNEKASPGDMTANFQKKAGKGLLILSRGLGERIVIINNETDDQIFVEPTMIMPSYDKAKIGITAPNEIKIFREEIYNRTERPKSANDADIQGLLACCVPEITK